MRAIGLTILSLVLTFIGEVLRFELSGGKRYATTMRPTEESSGTDSQPTVTAKLESYERSTIAQA